MKPPKIRCVSESEGTLQVHLNIMGSGEMPAEYVDKYTTKGVPKRGARETFFW